MIFNDITLKKIEDANYLYRITCFNKKIDLLRKPIYTFLNSYKNIYYKWYKNKWLASNK